MEIYEFAQEMLILYNEVKNDAITDEQFKNKFSILCKQLEKEIWND